MCRVGEVTWYGEPLALRCRGNPVASGFGRRRNARKGTGLPIGSRDVLFPLSSSANLLERHPREADGVAKAMV